MNGPPLSRRNAIKLGAIAMTGLAGCLVRPANSGPDPNGGGPGRKPTEEEPDSTPPGTDDDCSPDATVPSGPLTVDFDSRDRFRCQGRLLEDFSNLSYWEVLDGSLDGAESPFPGQSARLSATESQVRTWIARRFDDGIDLSEWDVSLAVNPGTGETSISNLRVQLIAPDRDNRLDMWHPVGETDGWLRLDFGPTEEFGSPDLTDVREIRIQAWVGDERAAEFFIDEMRVTPKLDEGAVVVTFDDIAASEYANVAPVMQKFEFAGVAGAVPWTVGQENQVTLSQLEALQDAGWDVVSYPGVRKSLPEYVRSQQESLILEAKQWLVDNGFEAGSRFIIFPSGDASRATFDIASKYHYLGLWDGQCPSGLLTGPLSVSRVNGGDAETAMRIVELAQKYRQVAVLRYTTIGGPDDRITTEVFEETMQFIADRGIRVITASDLWELQSSPN